MLIHEQNDPKLIEDSKKSENNDCYTKPNKKIIESQYIIE